MLKKHPLPTHNPTPPPSAPTQVTNFNDDVGTAVVPTNANGTAKPSKIPKVRRWGDVW